MQVHGCFAPRAPPLPHALLHRGIPLGVCSGVHSDVQVFFSKAT